MTADTHNPAPDEAANQADSTDSVAGDLLQAAPLAPGAALSSHTISRLLVTSDSGYTYLADDGATVIQEYFPLQFAVRDTDNTSLLLCDAQFNTDYEQGLTEFLRLARVLSQLDHPGRIAHYQENDGVAWYAVELPVRASFADLLQPGQRLPEETLRAVLYAATTYLDAIHETGGLHLELTPGRILIADEDQLLICGFSTDRFHYPPDDAHTEHDFRAPELASYRGQLGRWTDYYALGAILYQAVCRSVPVDSLTRLDAFDRGLEDPLPSVMDAGEGYFSPTLLSLIDQLLSLDTDERPQNAEELIDAIEPRGVLDTEPADPPELSVEAKPAKPRKQQAYKGPANGGKAITRRGKGASSIVLSALDKTKNAVNLEKPVPPRRNTKVSSIDESHTTKPVKTPGRQEPLFTGGAHDIKTPSAETRAPLKIADDLEDADQVLTEQNFQDFSLPPQSRAKTQPKRSQALPHLDIKKWSQRLRSLFKHYSVRFGVGVLLALVAIYILYLLVTPPGADRDAASNTTIEIIGATDLTPSDTPTLEIAQIGSSSESTIPQATEFAKDDDLARANAYRDAEKLARLSEPHLARARTYLAEGHLISPPDANAYSEFRTVLKMDPDSSAAQRGIDQVTAGVLIKTEALAKNNEFSDARAFLDGAVAFIGDSPEFQSARSNIETAQAQWKQQQALAKLEADKARRAREQQQKIETLLAAASTAMNENRLRTPPGANALAIYRTVLTLDPANARARNGIKRITQVYLDEARDALAQNQLGRAAQELEAAAAVDPTNPNVVILSTQLQRRQYLETEQQRLQTEADERISQAQAIADEQASLNLTSGVTAYYNGNYPRAYQFLTPLAQEGEPQAQVRVARMLLEARGTNRDKPKAIAMFSAALAPIQLAAREGRAWAQSDLADYFVDGFVIDKDLSSAAFWYRKAAEQGYAPAQTNLGWLYFNGYDGVAPNRAVAVHWFSEAAAQGNRTAVRNLQALGEEIPGEGGS